MDDKSASARTPAPHNRQRSVSVVIPARSWDERLDDTVASLLAMESPDDIRIEIVVALAEDPPSSVPAGVIVVPNPSGTIPEALNTAISASSGGVIARVDARCLVQPDHVRRVLKGLEDPAIGCVGGAALVFDRGLFGSAYAVAFNSVLLGPTVYRYRRSSGPADTAYLGAWRRADLDALGGFDAALVRNQDNDLADRVRASGKVVWYDAGLVIGYFNDRDLWDALRHHHEFGLWRMIQRERGTRALTGRHVGALGVLAAAGVASLGALASRRSRPYALGTGVAAYVAAGTWAWRSATRLRRARPDIDGPPFHPLAPLLAPALAALLDAAWLTGLLRGMLSAGRTAG